jgi:hypothetical protein
VTTTSKAARRVRGLLAALTAVVLLAGTALLVYAATLEEQRRPAVPVEELLLANPVAVPGDPSWTLAGTRPAVDVQPVPGVVRNWTDQGTEPTLFESAFRYPTVAEAERAFWFDNPKWGVANKLQDPEPADVPGGLAADRAEGTCIGQEPPGCNIWVYWARYGQYTVLFTYFNVDSGVSHDAFAAHVHEVDRVVARRLDR